MSKFSIENDTKLSEIETHLANNAYLSAGPLPDAEDAKVALALIKNDPEVPSKEKYPNLYFWYANIRVLAPPVLEVMSKKAEAKKADTKKADVEDDLFGSDDDDDKEALEALKKKQEEANKKKEKKKPVARSIVIFDVKVYEQEQDLDELAKRIFALEIDGLMWRTEYRLVEIAFGMKKLQVGCTVEDDKVLTDDIFDKILEWEDEVQSCDIVSFQKV
mmetsp:Transcript_87241/g.121049  ORF Transcript_87241/g.121049 Transcript_87241/m.121049 type:complete len:218 (+) Transcript_87241:65-718(+)